MSAPRSTATRLAGLAVSIVLAALGLASRTVPHAAATGPSTTPAYAFDDEFAGAAGTRPGSKWSFQTGGSGWGNGELETYTDRPANAHLDGTGHLAIVARKETYTGADGITRNYTSARLYSSAPVTYGYAEARILLPAGQGLWPAFWSLGANITKVDWPACGEIDALESYNAMTSAYGAIHGADYAKRAAYVYNVKTTPAGGLAGTWHTYAVSHTSTAISWYVDGVKYATVSRSSLTSGQDWPYDQAQYLLLDLAVGGTGGGTPGPDVASTATGGSVMLVDWVHAGAGLPPDAH
jgi:beta-glucanase (GH16 family)